MKVLSNFKAYVLQTGAAGDLCEKDCQIQVFSSVSINSATNKAGSLTNTSIEITEGQGWINTQSTYKINFTLANEVNKNTVVQIHPVSEGFLPANH